MKAYFDINIDPDDNDTNRAKYSLVQLGTDSTESTISDIHSLMKEMILTDYSFVYLSHMVDKLRYHIVI